MPYETREPPSNLRVSQETPGDWVEITLADTGGGFRITADLPRHLGTTAAYDPDLDAFVTVENTDNHVTPWARSDGRILWDSLGTVPEHPHASVHGIAIAPHIGDNGIALIADNTDDKLYAYDLASIRLGNLTRSPDHDIDYDASQNRTLDLAADADTVWALRNTGTRRLLAYSLGTLDGETYGDYVAARNIDLVAANTNPLACTHARLAADASRVLVLDTADTKMYAYDADTGAHDSGDDIALDLASPDVNANPAWIAADDDARRVYVADSTDKLIYAYNYNGDTESGEHIPLDRDDRLAMGIYVTGNTAGVLSLRLADSQLVPREVPIDNEAVRKVQCSEARATDKTGFANTAKFYALMYGGQPYSSNYRRL